MSYLGNTPTKATQLSVEARKSFSLGVWLKDEKGRPADLTGCVMTIVAKSNPDESVSDGDNLLAANADAIIPRPKEGYARFDIQAQALNVTPDEYPYVIVLRTADGYSSVVVKGVLTVLQNTEIASVNYSYASANPPQSLTVQLRDAGAVNVFIGGQLPPGMNYVRDDVMAAIENFDPDAIAMVPDGGAPGYVLTKTNSGDYSMAWLPVGNGQFALDASSQPAGYIPTARGDGTWIWKSVGLDATGATAGHAPVAKGDGTWEWKMVSPTVDWDKAEGEPGSILNKPSLDYLPASTPLSDISGVATKEQVPLIGDLRGVVFTTTIPVTGQAGYLYFVYTP